VVSKYDQKIIGTMGKQEKLLIQILNGQSDANINFHDLLSLMNGLGFDKRVSGSHHILQERRNIRKD